MRSSGQRLRRLADRRHDGFTILEILISTFILVVGLVGVLALFPAGINVGRTVVEKSTAITLARSVADAIRTGMRNNLRVATRSGGVTFTYFVFQHDGVKAAPRRRRQENPRGNYYILLPRHIPGRAIQGRSDGERRRRAAVGDRGKTFVYPETDDPANGVSGGFGNPFKADDDKNEQVQAVYRFGSTLPTHDDEGPAYLEDQKDDVLKQYSYAFSIRSSIYDTNMNLRQGNFIPGDELFHVRVMIFRAFDYVAGGEPQQPVYELDFEVAR